MNNQKIIEMIQKTESATFRIDGLGETTIPTKELKFLVDAYEKQIPKKVKYKTTCPTCNTYNSVWGKRINTKPDDIVHCWHCGNAVKLDWSVEE